MSIRHLGETFDVHGGGMDLIFPHHENEIAQSCGATGKEFARYWVHNGFVQINKEKMSKSLGNFFTIREIFATARSQEGWSDETTGEVLRYFLLSTHYRGPLDFSDQSLREAKNALNGVYDLFERLREIGTGGSAGDEGLRTAMERAAQGFERAMDDDLNSPVAIAELQRLRGEANKLLERGVSEGLRHGVRETFRRLGSVLGLFQLDGWQFNPLKVRAADTVSIGMSEAAKVTVRIADAEIEEQLAERNLARKRRDFRKADEIRAYLASHGITIEDKPDGTTRWKR